MQTDGEGRSGRQGRSAIPRVAAPLFPEGVVADELPQVAARIQDGKDGDGGSDQPFQYFFLVYGKNLLSNFSKLMVENPTCPPQKRWRTSFWKSKQTRVPVRSCSWSAVWKRLMRGMSRK